MKKLFRILVMLVVSVALGLLIAQATTYWQAMDTNVDGTNEFSIDTSGNTEIAGTLTTTGAVTINNVLTVSGNTAPGAMFFGGAYTTLPTSGFSAGTIIYVTGGSYTPTSPHFYGSTATVTTVSCWRALSFSGD